MMPIREERAFSGDPTEARSVAHPKPSSRIPVLDGWRATSILLVLGAHLLPLGPKALQLNFVAGAAGMALFFTLSGFLITQFLAAGMPIHDFLARRLARIVPLGWTAVTVLLLWQHADAVSAIRNYLFIANIPPATLIYGGEHLWSLCVEMQFYLSIALICLVFGRRGLYLVPVLAIGVTCARVIAGEHISIVTWHRIDEILAGGFVALAYVGMLGHRVSEALKKVPVWPLAIALVVCSHPEAGPLQYLRPYAASLLVGASLSNCPPRLSRLLMSQPMAYIAEISYALYVIHEVLSVTWLGTGDRTGRLLKKPLLFGVTFGMAHFSTRYFEQPITRKVRKLTSGWRQNRAVPSASPAAS